jgi:hypothetical protein
VNSKLNALLAPGLSIPSMLECELELVLIAVSVYVEVSVGKGNGDGAVGAITSVRSDLVR